MAQSKFSRFSSYLGVGALAVIFFGLGIWQWQRAVESRTPAKIERALISLESVTQPRIEIPGKAILRRVVVSGKYVANFQAPNQNAANGKIATWEVGLLQNSKDSAILVVRGLWSERERAGQIGEVTVTGILAPHQYSDHAERKAGSLSRIDSALIVNEVSLNLYDGYIVADNESGGSKRSRISPPAPSSAIPGFYWQHISYIIIWWLMGGIVLYLPFYQRRVVSEDIVKESEL